MKGIIKPKITVVNVVASFMFERPLDLNIVREAFKDICFFETLTDRRFTFRVVGLRFKNPQCTYLIYRTAAVCTGAKSTQIAIQSDQFLLRLLRKAGIHTRLKTQSRIRNIVATAKLPGPVDLERFLIESQKERQLLAIYEPEQFPGAVLRIPFDQAVKVVALVFGSGKFVVVGATTLEQVEQAVKTVVSTANGSRSFL